ncbi:MAG TPA: hypothetical protein VGI83_01105 [Gemmatimonadales bacterium]
MYKVSSAATPRSAGRRSVAFFVGRSRAQTLLFGAGVGAALVTLFGCADPARPTFPAGQGADVTPPDIQIVAPGPTDTIVTAGSTVNLVVQVRDASTLTDVACDVTGVTSFNFTSLVPDDTSLSVTFPIPTPAGKTGRVVVTLTASDAFDNGSTKTFAFVVR